MEYEEFLRGYDAQSYVGNLRNYRSFVRELMGQATADPSHVNALRQKAGNHPAPVYASIMTEDWCGDSACNLPILASLFRAAETDLRIFRGSENKQIEKRYHAEGVDHIPVISIWDGNGREIGRWIEAPAAVTQRKNAWKSEHADFMVLYEQRKNNKDTAQRFAALYREFLEVMAGWYVGGMWTETTREVVELLE